MVVRTCNPKAREVERQADAWDSRAGQLRVLGKLQASEDLFQERRGIWKGLRRQLSELRASTSSLALRPYKSQEGMVVIYNLNTWEVETGDPQSKLVRQTS